MGRYTAINKLQTFSAEDWLAMRKVLRQQISQTSEVFVLFDYLQKNISKSKWSWEAEGVRRRLFPDIQNKTFLNLVSRLNLHINDWLIHEYQNKQPIQRQLYLLSSYLERGLHHEAAKLYRHIQSELLSAPVENWTVIQQKHELYHSMYYSDHPMKYDATEDLHAKLKAVFGHRQHLLGHLYEVERYNISKINNVPTEKYSQSGFDYGDLQKLVLDNDVEAFYRIKDAIEEGTWQMPDFVAEVMMMYAVVWSSKLWQLGRLSEYQTVQEIYKRAVEDGVLVNRRRLPERRYYNIISVMHDYEEGDWVGQFINKYYSKVGNVSSRDHLFIGSAFIAFYNEDYYAVIDRLAQINSTKPFMKVRINGLLVIAWYELRSEYTDVFLNAFYNFKRQLGALQRKLSDYQYRSYANALSLLEALYHESTYERLQKMYHAMDALVYRKYFKNRIDEKLARR